VLAKIHAINARRPWLPVRGWILQQIIKLAFVGSLQEDVALIADSDVVLIRELNASSFLQNGSVRFYRLPDGVHSGMANHLLWHDCARRLLGLSSIASSTLPDYVSAFVAWSPAIVRRIQGQIAKISGIDWASSIAQQLHFSECVLYGAYVDNLGAASDRAVIGADTLCRSYWSDEPLTELEAENFVASVERRDLAILLQSKSHTPLPLRRRIVEMVAQRAE
jgi:hypothetical protein